jgi:hypothetical protein
MLTHAESFSLIMLQASFLPFQWQAEALKKRPVFKEDFNAFLEDNKLHVLFS